MKKLLIIVFLLFLILLPNVKSKEIESKINKIKVDIKGYVINPGVYELEENSTVYDLISISGGLNENADTSIINLSKRLKDQDVVIVYSISEVNEMRNGSTSIKIVEKECICPKIDNVACINDNNIKQNEDLSDESNKGSKINLNTATIDELKTLTGIGDSKAKSIIEYRKNKPFSKIEDLMEVKGIGQTMFNKIKENISV